MAFTASDIVPLSQARANFSELADQVKAGAEKIVTKNGESYVAIVTPSAWTITTNSSASTSTCS